MFSGASCVTEVVHCIYKTCQFSLYFAAVWKPYGLNIGLGYYNGKPFSTYDEDRSGFNCAKPENSHGAFWYSACSDVNPNGLYVKPGSSDHRYAGIIYNQWMGFESLKSTKMMIRRNPQ